MLHKHFVMMGLTIILNKYVLCITKNNNRYTYFKVNINVEQYVNTKIYNFFYIRRFTI